MTDKTNKEETKKRACEYCSLYHASIFLFPLPGCRGCEHYEERKKEIQEAT